MKALDLIHWALSMTDGAMNRLVSDMRDRPMTQPTSAGGNHPVWVLGHIAFIEGSVRHILNGEPNPVEHWGKLFAPGSQPSTDPGVYPSFDELLKTCRDLRAANLRQLQATGEAGLDAKPKNIPPGFEDVMASVGRTYVTIALHQMVHYGEICDARRAAGLKPLL
jgi:hypothetical protein